MYNDFYSELYHYGVVGMRKGQRRWTNPDGTLNAAGKSRYAEGKVGSGYTSARAAANKQRNSMNSQAALRSGSVGSSYTNARANRNRQMNSMNSQAALRMAPASTSFARDDKRTIANSNPARKRRIAAANAGAASASYRQAQTNAAKSRNEYIKSTERQKASMNSQTSTASARDRKRITNEQHSNRFNSFDPRITKNMQNKDVAKSYGEKQRASINKNRELKQIKQRELEYKKRNEESRRRRLEKEQIAKNTNQSKTSMRSQADLRAPENVSSMIERKKINRRRSKHSGGGSGSYGF